MVSCLLAIVGLMPKRGLVRLWEACLRKDVFSAQTAEFAGQLSEFNEVDVQ